MKIIRVLWGDKVNHEVPRIPLLKDEVVYVYSMDHYWELKARGFELRVVKEDIFNGEWNTFGKKLQCLDLALQEFGEVILLDWDCYQVKPFDDKFYKLLKQKPIQIPLYIQHKDTKNAILDLVGKNQSFKFMEEMDLLQEGFRKYGWEWEDGLVAPNFGFVYCRDKSFAKKLIDLAIKEDLKTVVDEFATKLYVDCTLEEYIEKYCAPVLKGRSDEMFVLDCKLHEVSKKFSKWLDTKIKIKSYFEHV
tara:strand:+ start:2748 stop:3491 length:744 start_codon:yes stop_codon:yes gene_type:complete